VEFDLVELRPGEYPDGLSEGIHFGSPFSWGLKNSGRGDEPWASCHSRRRV
jgi:hypothetical protein